MRHGRASLFHRDESATGEPGIQLHLGSTGRAKGLNPIDFGLRSLVCRRPGAPPHSHDLPSVMNRAPLSCMSRSRRRRSACFAIRDYNGNDRPLPLELRTTAPRAANSIPSYPRQRRMDTVKQVHLEDWLNQKTNCSRAQSLIANSFIRKRRDHDDWYTIAQINQPSLKLKTGYPTQLHIGN